MKVWLVLPPMYYLYTWFNANPTIFNPEYMAVFYDPFYGTKDLQGNIEVCMWKGIRYTRHNTILNMEINSQEGALTTLISTIFHGIFSLKFFMTKKF